MGNECSNCKCTNTEEEKTLVISNSTNGIKNEKRKDILENNMSLSKSKNSNDKSFKAPNPQVKTSKNF